MCSCMFSRRLTREHDGVCAVKHSIGHICHLSTCGQGVADHTLQHLCGCDDKLASDVCLGDHHLLSKSHLGAQAKHTHTHIYCMCCMNHDAAGKQGGTPHIGR